MASLITLLALLASALSQAVPAVAPTQAEDGSGATVDAVVATVSIIWVLAADPGFVPGGPLTSEVVAVGAPAEWSDPSALHDQVSDYASDAGVELEERGVPVGDELTLVLRNGETDAEIVERALAQALLLIGLEPTPRWAAESARVINDAAGEAPASSDWQVPAEAATSTVERTGSLPLLVGVLVAAALMVLGGLGWLLGARRRHPSEQDLLDMVATGEAIRAAELGLAELSRRQQGRASALVVDGELVAETEPGVIEIDHELVERAVIALAPRSNGALWALPLGAVSGAVLVEGETEPNRTGSELVRIIGLGLRSARQSDELRTAAEVDALTGVANRRRFDQDLADRRGETALILLDVDHFKHYNDTNGHQAGDRLLAELGGLLERTVRRGDVVYRYGGEEFAVLLADTDPVEAAGVAQRLCESVREHGFAHGEDQPMGRLTISVGAAIGPPARVTGRADEALYAAKGQGRNRAVMSS